VATNPGPPPIKDESLSFGLRDWLSRLYGYIGDSFSTVPWATVDKSGSNLSEIQTRIHGDLQNLTSDDHQQYVLADGTRNITGQQEFEDSIVLPKTSGKGVKVDTASPSFGWRDLLGVITVKGTGGGGASANPDYVVYRGGLYAYRFGTVAPNNHNHEAFIEYHIPHDYVPGSDLYLHVHWSQKTVDTGGTAGVPGVANWYFEYSYADGHGTPGGSANAFSDPVTVSVTQQASTTQYGHMIAEVQISNDGGIDGLLDSNTIAVDGLLLVRIYRDPTDSEDTLNQDTFVHFVDVHYQSTNMATKNKAPNFYS
jgi:hypothetical protein